MSNSYIFTSAKQLGLKFYDLDQRGPIFNSHHLPVKCKVIKHLSSYDV